MNIQLSGTVTTVAVTIILAMVSGAYYVGTAISSNRIEHLNQIIKEYENSGHLNTPETLKALQAAAKQFNLSAAERKELEMAKKEVSDLTAAKINLDDTLLKNKHESEKTIDELQKRIGDLDRKISELKKELSAYVPNQRQFTIKTGQSEELIKNQYRLGVGDVYEDYFSGRLNSDSLFLHVGENKSFTHLNKECKLWLLKIEKKVAYVSFGCSER